MATSCHSTSSSAARYRTVDRDVRRWSDRSARGSTPCPSGIAKRRRPCDGARVAVQLAVQCRTKAFGAFVQIIRLPGVDVALHAVVQTVPTEHAMRGVPMLVHPAGVLLLHVRKDAPQQRRIAIHLV